MKIHIMAGIMLVATCARGSVNYSAGPITEDTVIPNGNPVGVTFNMDITSSDVPAGDVISGLTVGLDISGGRGIGGVFGGAKRDVGTVIKRAWGEWEQSVWVWWIWTGRNAGGWESEHPEHE